MGKEEAAGAFFRKSGDGLGAADIGKMALIGKNPPFQICRVTAVTQHFFVMVRLDDDASGTVKQVHRALRNTAEVREIADTDILRLYFEADAARTVVRSRDRRDPEPRQDFRPGRIEEGLCPFHHQAVSGAAAHKDRGGNPLHADCQALHVVRMRMRNQHGIDGVKAIAVLCQRLLQHGCADAEVNQKPPAVQVQKHAVAG